MTTNRTEPTFENQIWHARNLLARKGLAALESPHAMTGKICRCGSCFCCAALQVANEARDGTAKIYWRDLQSGIPVRVVKGQYITAGNSLVYWNGHEAREAQTALNEAANAVNA